MLQYQIIMAWINIAWKDNFCNTLNLDSLLTSTKYLWCTFVFGHNSTHVCKFTCLLKYTKILGIDQRNINKENILYYLDRTVLRCYTNKLVPDSNTVHIQYNYHSTVVWPMHHYCIVTKSSQCTKGTLGITQQTQ